MIWQLVYFIFMCILTALMCAWIPSCRCLHGSNRFPPWVESARRFARGYLVRLRTHQVTSPDALILKGRWAAQIQYSGVIKCHPFWGGSNSANQWWFWGISLIIMRCLGRCHVMTPDTPIGKPWFRSWFWRCETFFFEIEGRSAQIRMCPPLLQWVDLDFEIDFGAHVKQISLKLQYQFPVTGKQDL